MPNPQQPFLHDLVCVLAAPTQVWSAADGEVGLPVGAGGLAGLLHADVRVLSGLRVRGDGAPAEHLATRSSGSTAVFTGLLRHGGDDSAAARPPVRLDRRREVAPGRLAEELRLSSEADGTTVELEVTLVADATAVQRVNDGYPAVRAEIAQPGPSTLAWEAAGVAVRVEAPGASVARSTDRAAATLRWSVEVPARGEVVVGWSLAAFDPGGVVVPAPAGPWAYRTVPGTDHRLVGWLERAAADLAALRMATAAAPDDVFYAAGAPWYLTLFGRDSLWAARMVLPVGPRRPPAARCAPWPGCRAGRSTRGRASSPARSRTSCAGATYRLGGPACCRRCTTAPSTRPRCGCACCTTPGAPAWPRRRSASCCPRWRRRWAG